MNLFRSIFPMAAKGASDCTYTFSGVDMEVKAKFKGLFCKLRDWKAHFLGAKKSFSINVVEAEVLTSWSFTT